MQRMVTPESPPIREAVGVFTDISSFYECIDQLQQEGFDRSEISLLNYHDLQSRSRRRDQIDTRETEDDPKVKRNAFIDPQSLGDAQGAIIGLPTYVLTMAGLAIGISLEFSMMNTILSSGIGGLVGFLLGMQGSIWLKSRSKVDLDEQINHGGIPVWIRIHNVKQERQALSILSDSHAEDIHVHDLEEQSYPVEDGRTTVVHILH
ncbi:hypothetical protein [Sneathiella limimaris]|uniref:hypothetical protein n=1 Tax=Sneathiella limimaris TaxID=1964213 RepID=UPI00146C0334|nr:hypothetical protein [Sneathiella limimaris]